MLVNHPSIRTMVVLLITLIIMGIIIWSMPPISIHPVGIFLPANSLKNIAPESSLNTVNLYSPLTAPNHYDILGTVNIAYHTTTGTEEDAAIVQQYAQQLAANAGANGIIVKLFGHTMSNSPPALASQVLTGMAIKEKVQ
jgi:hypothetical protein